MPAADRTTPQTVRKKLRRKSRPAGTSSGSGGGPQGTGRITTPRPVPRPRPAPVRAPSKTQLRSARAQQREHVSQGKAVRKAARQQRKNGPHIGPPKLLGGDVKSQADLSRAERFVASEYPKGARFYNTKTKKYGPVPKGNVIPPDVNYKQARQSTQLAEVARIAPALKVLEQTTRPLHGVAAGTRAAIKGQNVPKAVLRGVENKDKSTFSDVLKTAGVKNKTVRGVAGFVGDVALDPTTYVSGGTASLAEHAAAKAARDAAKEAAVQGLSKKATQKAVSHAARSTYTATRGKGVTVKVAGKELPGVRRATGAVGKSGGQVTRKAVPERTRNAVRAKASDVNPNVAPVGVSKATHQKAVQATRTARGKTTKGQREAIDLAHGIRRRIGEHNYAQVTDALEAQDLSKLPPELVPHAQMLRAKLAEIRAVQRKAGVKVPERKGYVPHKLTPQALEADAKKAGRAGGSGVNPKSSLARKEQRTMAELRQQEPGRYREDLHAIVAERMAEGTQSAARADLAQEIARLGRAVTRGTKVRLKPDEGLYRVKRGKDLQEIDPNAKAWRKPPKPDTKSKFVVLPRKVVDRAKEGVNPTPSARINGEEYGIIHGIDRATGVFKRLAVGTPGFHVRNFTGDTMQAYIKQPAPKLAANMVRAKRVTKTMAKAQDAARDLKPPAPSGRTLKTSKYGDVPLETIAENLVKHGAARSGYTARELRELGQSGRKEGGRIRKGMRGAKQNVGDTETGQKLKRFNLTREDWPRIATAIHSLQNGATWQEAAQHVANVHFDYAHLTPFERNVARRIMPFYTWSSRNIPFQAKNVLQHPGKYAAYEKVREEAANATRPEQTTPQVRNLYRMLEQAGVKMDGGWQKYLSAYEQRNAGIPVSIGGQKFTESIGLPLTDLNEAPGAALGSQIEEWYQKGMSLTGPIPKDIIEYMENHSFFFRDQLERDNSPLVAAPSWAVKLPARFRKWAQVGPMIDKRTGKKVLGWRGKADYVFSVVPGTPQYVKQFTTTGTNQQGKGIVGKALGFAGVKSVPIDPAKNATNLAYARMAEIQKQLAALHQRGVNKDHPTAEWRKLNDQLKITTQIAYQGKAAGGYRVLPSQGGPSKGRVSSPGSSSSSGTDLFGRSKRRSSSSGTDLFGRSSSSSSTSSGTDLFGRSR